MIITIITFLIILTFLVFIHELGHFYTARKTGTKVEEFGLGLPPRMIGVRKVTKPSNSSEDPPSSRLWRTRWEWVSRKADSEETEHTIYSLNWLPIGGFVKIKGENEAEVGTDSFSAKSAGKRTLMLVAGVIMNFIAAAVILSIAFGIGFPSVIDETTDLSRVKNREVQIVSVLDNSPATAANIESGDVILKLDDFHPETSSEIQKYISTKENQTITLELQRGSESINTNLSPVFLEETQSAALGIGLIDTGVVRYPVHQAIWKGVSGTVIVTGEIFKAFGKILSGFVSSNELKEQISGPIGIAVLTGQFVELGFVAVLQFAAMLSINLAIINILPFPALDGGRILFIILEKLRGGRPVSKKLENVVHTIGFSLLILLIIFVTVNDFSRYGSQIFSAVKGIF